MLGYIICMRVLHIIYGSGSQTAGKVYEQSRAPRPQYQNQIEFSNIIYCIFCYAFILIVQYYLDRVYRLRTTRVKAYKFIVPTTYYSWPNTFVRKSYATKLFTKLQQIIDRSFFTSCGFKPGIPGFRGSVDFFLPFRWTQ